MYKTENGKQPVLKHFGKSMQDILLFKKMFFNDNDSQLEGLMKITELYLQQPKREKCKMCQTAITPPTYFKSHGINYYLCGNCGHLNGEYDDTECFSEKMYTSVECSEETSDQNGCEPETGSQEPIGGGGYGSDYREDDKEQYISRMDSTYTPKARFLESSLDAVGEKSKSLTFLDIGAGAGYMVGAMRHLGLEARGVEVNKQQVAYANKMLSSAEALRECRILEITQIIKSTKSNVLTFIGVLEHMTNLEESLIAIRSNPNVKYMFFSVPLLSLTCAIQAIFPQIFPRHLGGGHTHLFSEQSLSWMYNYYNFTPLAEWRFGTDIMDLYRSIVVMLAKNGADEKFIQNINNFFCENTDMLQLVLDKSNFTSEIHVLARTN